MNSPFHAGADVPKLRYFKEYTHTVVSREGIPCTVDWRYYSTARFFIRPRIVRIGYARLKECYRFEGFIPEWSRGVDLCREMTRGNPLLKAHWVILHELTHAKLVEFGFRDAHNRTFYKTLAAMAVNHLEPRGPLEF